jgi:hypothetical protein
MILRPKSRCARLGSEGFSFLSDTSNLACSGREKASRQLTLTLTIRDTEFACGKIGYAVVPAFPWAFSFSGSLGISFRPGRPGCSLIARRNMTIPAEEAFLIFEAWRLRTSSLYVTGPLRAGFGRGTGKFPGRVVDVDASCKRVQILAGTPETGEEYVQVDVHGASFAVAPAPGESSVCLTAQLSSGDRVFFVERIFPSTSLTAIKNRGTR